MSLKNVNAGLELLDKVNTHPVLQALRALAVRVLLCLAFLSEMALVVRDDLAHVLDVVFLVLAWILLRVLLEDCDDFAAT